MSICEEEMYGCLIERCERLAIDEFKSGRGRGRGRVKKHWGEVIRTGHDTILEYQGHDRRYEIVEDTGHGLG